MKILGSSLLAAFVSVLAALGKAQDVVSIDTEIYPLRDKDANYSVNQARQGLPQTLIWAVEYEGSTKQVLLSRVGLRADSFQAYARVEDGSIVKVDVGPSNVFRGIAGDTGGAVVIATLGIGEAQAMIFQNARAWSVSARIGVDGSLMEPAIAVEESNVNSTSNCGSVQGPSEYSSRGSDIGFVALPFVAEVACHVDYRAYLESGGTLASALALVESRLGTASYFFELYTGMQLQLTAVHVETAAAQDPFYDIPADYLEFLLHFQKIWNNTDVHVPKHLPPPAASAPRDGAFLISGHVPFQGVNGYAYIGYMGYHLGLAYSYTTIGASNSTQEATVLTHEIGHMFDASHCTGACGLMYPTLNTDGYFAQVSIDEIVAHRDTFVGAWTAGTPSIAPTISSLNPTQVLVLGQSIVGLTGVNLDTALHVNVGLKRLYFGNYTVAGSSSLSFVLPVVPIGVSLIFVVGAGGASNAVPLDVVESPSLVLLPDGNPLQVSPYLPFTWYYAAPVGSDVALVVSGSSETVVVNGHAVLRNASILDFGVVPPAGFREHEETLTGAAELFWVQALKYSGGVLVDATVPLEHYLQ